MLTLGEADAELQRLTVLRKNHADEQYLARRLRELPPTIARLTERVAHLDADFATVTAHANNPLTIGTWAVSGSDAMGTLGQRLEELTASVRDLHRVPLGSYRWP